MNTTEQRVFILIGRSGCGKGTQGKMIEERLRAQGSDRGVLYIQTGAGLREFIKGESATQKMCRDIYMAGGLQPEFLAVYTWINMLIKGYTGNEHLIFDGSPRKYHEAGVVDSIFDFYKIPHATVIHIDVSKEWAKTRLMARGRLDDTEKDIEKRLTWYDTDTVPAIDYFKKDPKYSVIGINGERPIEEVFADIVAQAKL